jgi:hypothetical protein
MAGPTLVTDAHEAHRPNPDRPMDRYTDRLPDLPDPNAGRHPGRRVNLGVHHNRHLAPPVRTRPEFPARYACSAVHRRSNARSIELLCDFVPPTTDKIEYFAACLRTGV